MSIYVNVFLRLMDQVKEVLRYLHYVYPQRLRTLKWLCCIDCF